jgi:hypothetical protein
MNTQEAEEKARKIVEWLADYDYNHCGDYFGWKFGGEGDNGEILIKQLSLYFRYNNEYGKDNIC